MCSNSPNNFLTRQYFVVFFGYSVWVEDLGMDGGVRQFENNYFVISKIMGRMILKLGRYFESWLFWKNRGKVSK